jgi:hypothetical protein
VDGKAQQRLPFFEGFDLHPQGISQFEVAPTQHASDLSQQKPQKVQCDGLLQGLQITSGVEAVSRLTTTGPQQPGHAVRAVTGITRLIAVRRDARVVGARYPQSLLEWSR